jgi:hypothetical protein
MSKLRASLSGISENEDPGHFSSTASFVNRIIGTPCDAAAQSTFQSLADHLMTLSSKVREITGLRRGTMIPGKDYSDQDREKILQQVWKNLQGQLKSKSAQRGRRASREHNTGSRGPAGDARPPCEFEFIVETLSGPTVLSSPLRSLSPLHAAVHGGPGGGWGEDGSLVTLGRLAAAPETLFTALNWHRSVH